MCSWQFGRLCSHSVNISPRCVHRGHIYDHVQKLVIINYWRIVNKPLFDMHCEASTDILLDVSIETNIIIYYLLDCVILVEVDSNI